jgi:hypothetical protein
VAERVSFGIDTSVMTLPQVQSGTLRPLADNGGDAQVTD